MPANSGTLRPWHARAALLLVVLVLVSSCRAKLATGTVTGTVKYNGEPVPCGQVVFYGENDQSAVAAINEDGSYTAKAVPTGSVKVVLIMPPSDEGMKKAAKAGMKRFGEKGPALPESVKTFSLPKHYSDPSKSGLGLTVHEGTQPYDIILTEKKEKSKKG